MVKISYSGENSKVNFQEIGLISEFDKLTKGILKATLTQETGSQVVLGEMGTGEIVGEIQILIGGKY